MPTTTEILTAGGLKNASSLVTAASRTGVPLYIAAAFCQQESGGQNIYGHDAGGIFNYGSGTTVQVTEQNYADFYQKVVVERRTSNGVGPMQITYPGYFPQAKAQGLRLWVPVDNMVFGLNIIKGYLGGDYSEASINRAAQRYNSGSATGAPAYGSSVVLLARTWKNRLAGASTPVPAVPVVTKPKPAPKPVPLVVDGKLGPATIRRWQQALGTPVDGVISRPSSLVRVLQQRLNNYGFRGLDGRRLVVDGIWGPNTIAALQRCYRTPVDGRISTPSALIKAIQRQLNAQL